MYFIRYADYNFYTLFEKLPKTFTVDGWQNTQQTLFGP